METHGFLVEFAMLYGVEGSVMLNHFHFWIKKNMANKKHMYEGRYWTYNSIEALCDIFPYWSKRQIERILNNLVKGDILLKGNFNKKGYDRTMWYSINLPFYAISPNGEMDITKGVYSISPNGEMDITKRGNSFPQTVEPIPVSITDSITDSNINTTTNVVVLPLKKNKSKKVLEKQEKRQYLYSKSMDAYYLFYKERNGVVPKIDGTSGIALKQIIEYLKTVARNKDATIKEDPDRLDSAVIDSIDFIFFNWDLVRPFLREQYNLMQINSNLNNIMADIKKVPASLRRQKDVSNAYIYFKNYYGSK